jgi:hypothetical protein
MDEPNPYLPPAGSDVPRSTAPAELPLVATVRITGAIITRSMKLHFRSRRWMAVAGWILLALFVLVLIWQRPVLRTVRLLEVPILAAFFLVLWGNVTPFLAALTTRRRFRAMGEESQTLTYEVWPDYLRMRTEEVDARVPWSRFVQWREEDNLMLIYRQKRYFYMLPIDLLGADFAEAVRQCLHAHGIRQVW